MSISLALWASACGPRSQHVSSAFEPAHGPSNAEKTPPVAAQTAPATVELPTGDPALKNSAAALGKAPPDLDVNEWVNTSSPIQLKALAGHTVLVEFCELHDVKCQDARGLLSELQSNYGKMGFTVIEVFVDQPSSRTPAWEHWNFMKQEIGALQLPWPAGYGERTTYSRLRYGFPSVPAAYLVDSDGKLVWSGDPTVYGKSLRTAVDTIAGRAP